MTRMNLPSFQWGHRCIISNDSQRGRLLSVRSVSGLLQVMLICLFLSSCVTAPTADDLKKAESHNKRGVSYLDNGDLNKAFVEFQEALKVNPRDKETLNFLGYISARYGKFEEAVSYYKKAIAIDPNYTDAINNLGTVYASLQKWDKAIEQFDNALKDPTYRTPDRAYSNLGFVYYEKGDYAKAEKALTASLVRNPVSARTLYVLGLVYIKLGNDGQAVDSFMKAIGMVPDYVDAHWELANLYLRTGDKARALKHFEVVAEKDEDATRIRKASEYIQDLKYGN